MQGYVTKDRHYAHYMNARSEDINDEVVEEGQKRHMLIGAGEIKKRESLKAENFFSKVEMWWCAKTACDPDIILTFLVRDMLRSGNSIIHQLDG